VRPPLVSGAPRTLGVLMATVNASILLIALPDIFRGIGINPLEGQAPRSSPSTSCPAGSGETRRRGVTP
jgi:hypothetical protein